MPARGRIGRGRTPTSSVVPPIARMPDGRRRRATPRSSSMASSELDPGPVRVLVVDGDRRVRTSLGQLLELADGITLTGVSLDVEGAVRTLEGTKVDVVVMESAPSRLPGRSRARERHRRSLAGRPRRVAQLARGGPACGAGLRDGRASNGPARRPPRPAPRELRPDRLPLGRARERAARPAPFEGPVLGYRCPRHDRVRVDHGR